MHMTLPTFNGFTNRIWELELPAINATSVANFQAKTIEATASKITIAVVLVGKTLRDLKDPKRLYTFPSRPPLMSGHRINIKRLYHCTSLYNNI